LMEVIFIDAYAKIIGFRREQSLTILSSLILSHAEERLYQNRIK